MARAVAVAVSAGSASADTSGLERLAMSEAPQPTRRFGPIVTTVLLIALAGVAIWASLALSNTSLARWLGFVSPAPTRQITVPQPPDRLHSVLRVAPQPPVSPPVSPSRGSAPAPATTREAGPTRTHEPAPGFAASPARDRAPTLVTKPSKPHAVPAPKTAAGTSGRANSGREALAMPAGVTPPGAGGAAPISPPTARAAATNPAETPVKPDARKPLTHPEAAIDPVVAGIEQRAPGASSVPAQDRLGNLVLASIDPALGGEGAMVLPDASAVMPSPLPRAQGVPPGPGTRYVIDRRGMVVATPEGAITPDGVIVHSGRPPITPPRRGTAPQAGAPAPAATITPPRPHPRPANLAIIKNGRLHLAPTSATTVVVSGPPPAGTALAVNTSLVPTRRPAKFATVVAATRKAVATSALARQSAARRSAAVLPTRASVAKRATLDNSLRLGRLLLIGVYGSSSNRRALVRLASGRYVKLKVGDNFDGGRVAGIGAASLSYIKGRRTYTLKLPRNG